MTEYHDYNTPNSGSSDWHIPVNENFEKLDQDVEIRDVESKLNDYEPKDLAKFFAVDTGAIYVGNGTQWNQVGGASSSSIPNLGGRRLYADGDWNGEVDVPGDFPTIQEALDAMPWILGDAGYTVNVSDGTYDEHVVIPPVMASRWNAMGGEDVSVSITGNNSSPENVQINSITAEQVIGDLWIVGCKLVTEGARNEPTSAIAFNCPNTTFHNVHVAHNGLRGIEAYASDITVRNVDFSGVNDGVVLKRNSRGKLHRNMSQTGNVGDRFLYTQDSSSIGYYSESSVNVSGRAGGIGPIWEIDSRSWV
jgi:hypothetical protein